jgi:hypothetical protein
VQVPRRRRSVAGSEVVSAAALRTAPTGSGGVSARHPSTNARITQRRSRRNGSVLLAGAQLAKRARTLPDSR